MYFIFYNISIIHADHYSFVVIMLCYITSMRPGRYIKGKSIIYLFYVIGFDNINKWLVCG